MMFSSEVFDSVKTHNLMTVELTELKLIKVWVMNSECSQHITCRHKNFVKYKKFDDKHSIKSIKNTVLQSLSSETVILLYNVNSLKINIQLSEVIHCSIIEANLISVSQLLKKEIDIMFSQKNCYISNGFQRFSATIWDELFILDLWNQILLCTLVIYELSNMNLEIWHDWMSHLEEQNLQLLEKMTDEIDLQALLTETDNCKPCIMSWMKETLHKSINESEKYLMKWLHSDVSELFSVLIYNEVRYWVTVLDNCTQIAEIISIKIKNEIYTQLRAFLAINERSDWKCHQLWIDSDEEYRFKKITVWCEQREIVLKIITTEQHQ